MKVAIFGGTGGCGLLLLKQLIRDNVAKEITVLARDPRKLPQEIATHSSVKIVEGVATEAGPVGDTVQGADVIVNMIGGPAKGPGVDICSVSQNLINQAVNASNVTRMSLSSPLLAWATTTRTAASLRSSLPPGSFQRL